MKNIIFLFLLFSVISCNQDQGPEEVLRSYVNLRFQSGDNFKDLLSKTTGELNSDLKSLNKEERVKFDQSSMFKKKAIRILSRNCGDKLCKITYIISYERESGGNPYNAEIRNVANLKMIEGDWKISSIGGLKTYFESKKNIEP